MRGYTKGVAWKEELFFDKDGDSWVTEKFPLGDTRTPAVVRFSINWQTLRYKYAVEYGEGRERGSFGRCEEVQAGVKQH